MRITEIDESFDTTVDRQVLKSSPNGVTIKATIGNRDIVYMAHISTGFANEKIATIEFFQKDVAGITSTYDKTGAGNEMQVFSFIIDCVKDTIIDFSPDEIQFTSVKADGNRSRLYKRLATKIPGYKLKNIKDGRFEELFVFVRDK